MFSSTGEYSLERDRCSLCPSRWQLYSPSLLLHLLHAEEVPCGRVVSLPLGEMGHEDWVGIGLPRLPGASNGRSPDETPITWSWEMGDWLLVVSRLSPFLPHGLSALHGD